jgi:hypothetical protein
MDAAVIVSAERHGLARILAWIMLEAGWTVTTARSVAEVKEARVLAEVGVVVLGPEADPAVRSGEIRELREIAPGASVIELVMAAELSEGAPRDTGADIVIAMPFHVDDLLKELKRMKSQQDVDLAAAGLWVRTERALAGSRRATPASRRVRP